MNTTQLKTENMLFFFSKNVVYLRRKNKMTQQQFADTIGMKRCTIGAIEEGRALGIETVYNISRKYDVSIDELITTDISKTKNAKKVEEIGFDSNTIKAIALEQSGKLPNQTAQELLQNADKILKWLTEKQENLNLVNTGDKK